MKENKLRRVVLLLAVLASIFLVFRGGRVSGATAANATGQDISSLNSTQGVNASPAASGPNATCPAGGQCFADVISGNPFYDFINRLYQQDLVTGYACGGPGEPCDGSNRPYYRPGSDVTRQQMAKFIDNARHLPQIDIQVVSGNAPINVRNDAGNAIYAQTATSSALYGNATALGGTGVEGSGAKYGVKGASTTSLGAGVFGIGSRTGVYGSSTDTSGGAYGVYGDSSSPGGFGVYGSNSSSGIGVEGYSASGNAVYGVTGNASGNYAGYFQGNVLATGTCCLSSAGSYRIDDPTDPANKYLYHSSVESSDMLDIYRGHVNLDANGEAVVTMPSWFQALNEDFDYQLTGIGAPAPNLYIAEEITGNRFKIAGGKPGLKVSWQVTGVRHDPYSEQHPLSIQVDKPAGEQGTYIHPELYGQPASKTVSPNSGR